MFERIAAEAPDFLNAYNVMFLLQAMGRTLAMTLFGCLVGFTLGLLLALARRAQGKAMLPLRIVATLYVETFRRIPFLVILFIVLYAIQPIWPSISLLGVAIVAVCVLSAAFMAEIIRAGLESVPRAQIESAKVLNFSPLQSLWWVILPQAWKVIIPPAIAFAVMFVKDTSLASQLGVVELTFAGKMLVNRGFSPILGFGAVLIAYFILSFPLSMLGSYLEKRLGSPRRR
jgi:polar amino acid transport system permease protein